MIQLANPQSMKGFTDGRTQTDNLCENSAHYCGSASWINNLQEKEYATI